jgi:cysteine desulfurase
MIYLDYSANTPCDPEVLETFLHTEQAFPANPNSSHAAGLAAKEELTRITNSVAQLLTITSQEIIYTSGACVSEQSGYQGVSPSPRGPYGKHIILFAP